jgi:hypothetical protein
MREDFVNQEFCSKSILLDAEAGCDFASSDALRLKEKRRSREETAALSD